MWLMYVYACYIEEAHKKNTIYNTKKNNKQRARCALVALPTKQTVYSHSSILFLLTFFFIVQNSLHISLLT